MSLSHQIKKILFIFLLFILIIIFSPPSAFSEQNRLNNIRIGLTAVTIKSSVVVNNRFSEYIGQKLGVPDSIVIATLYSNMSRMLKNDEVDIAYVCGAPYVLDHDSFGEELLAVPVPAFSSGKPTYKSYVIVRKDSPYQSLKDLQGKRYAFSDPLSNSGKLVPTYLLAQKGYKIEDYFHSYIYTYSHSNSIEAVATGLVDGASVDGYIWKLHQRIDPTFSSKTKVIHQSQDFPFTPFVFRKSINFEIKEKIRSIFLEMHKDPEGKKILDKLFIERFVSLEDKDYNPIRDMFKFVNDFSGRKALINICLNKPLP